MMRMDTRKRIGRIAAGLAKASGSSDYENFVAKHSRFPMQVVAVAGRWGGIGMDGSRRTLGRTHTQISPISPTASSS